MVRNFEVQVYREGKWTIDSIYDDRDLALFEAQRMNRSGRFLGVRVLEEIVMGLSGENRTRVIYRGEAPKRRPAVRTPAKPPKKKKTSNDLVLLRRYQAYVEQMDTQRYRILMACMFVVIFGLAMLLGLQFSRM